MANLYFKYGTMNSAKTANLLMTAHTYRSRDKRVFLMKPKLDDRFSSDRIDSRIVPSAAVDLLVEPRMANFEALVPSSTDCVLVDEAQFLSEKNVDSLRELALRVPVLCYGLRTDYRSRLFEGSRRLMEVADTIEEILNVCSTCTKKAIVNSKYYTDRGVVCVVKAGSGEIDLGAEEKYRALCWECWSRASEHRKACECAHPQLYAPRTPGGPCRFCNGYV